MRSGNVFTVCQVSLPGGVLRSGKNIWRLLLRKLAIRWRWRDGQAMIALKETLREERKAFYARPENRRMGYWQWVEQRR
ncbi:hypothetical protein ACLBOM_37695 [Escherichia coli]